MLFTAIPAHFLGGDFVVISEETLLSKIGSSTGFTIKDAIVSAGARFFICAEGLGRENQNTSPK